MNVEDCIEDIMRETKTVEISRENNRDNNNWKVKIVTPEGKILEETAWTVDRAFEKLWQTLWSESNRKHHAAMTKRHKKYVQKHAAKMGVECVFTVQDKQCWQPDLTILGSPPEWYRANGCLKIGEDRFEQHFDHWCEGEMQDFLYFEAYEKYFPSAAIE